MTRRMLINAQNHEEMRVAIIDGSTLENFQVEVAEKGLTRGNIYRGIVSNVQPSLNAVFVDYGEARDGFLPFHDVVPAAWHRQPQKGGHHPRVEQAMERGKSIIVQVVKDPEGQKGAALTTNVSLAGRYLVFMPYDDTRGVSRKVEDDEQRQKLKEQASKLDVPEGAGFIVRTNAIEQTKTSLNRDFASLMRIWKKIESESAKGKGPRELYGDQDIVVRVLRDYLDSSIAEVLIDEDEAFARAQEYVRGFMPRGKTALVRYSDRLPLFTRYDIEPQIERIYDRTVSLPSGGSIVIDRTEALVAIDVNSGKSTRAATQEETAVNTNLEAAAEVARHLRLRDIGGLVVVDFIDMRSSKHRALVEKTLRDAMKADKARSSVGRISSNGLLEINRQKIQQALHLRTHRRCPTCQGTGRIASPEMVSLNLLRRIESRAAKGTLARARIALHPELADAFQNTKRQDIAALEREFDIGVEVIAATHLHRPEQEIEWTDRPPAERKQEKKSLQSPVSSLQTMAAVDGAQAEEEAKRGRKRRRGRRKKDAGPVSSAPADQASEWSEEPDPFALDEDFEDSKPAPSPAHEPRVTAGAPAGEGPRGRKRRRGRKKKEPIGASTAAHADEPGSFDPVDISSVAPPPASDPHQAAGSEPAAGEGGRSRKRRRGRRKKAPGHQAGAETQGQDGVPDLFEGWHFLPEELPAEPRETASGDEPPAPGEPAQGDEARRRKRPRRRSRRRKPAGEPSQGQTPDDQN